MTTDSEQSKLTRLNINISPNTADKINTLKTHQGGTTTDIISQAITLYAFFTQEARSGRRVETVNPNGEDRREIVIFNATH